MIESGVLTVRLGSTPSTSRRLAVPLSPRSYDGTPARTRTATPMGTLPAARGREHAGFGLQNRSSRRNRTQAKDARPDGDLSFRVYRRRCQNPNGAEPWVSESCAQRPERIVTTRELIGVYLVNGRVIWGKTRESRLPCSKSPP